LAPSNTNLALFVDGSAQKHELDLTLLQQAADGPQKAGWDKLAQLLHEAIQHRCDQITIEPDDGSWRTRFFAHDRHIEQIQHDMAELSFLSDNLSRDLRDSNNHHDRLRPLLAQVDQQRYIVEATQLPCMKGSMFTLSLKPWQPLPSSFNELQLPSGIDRRIRHWLSGKGGWLAVAGPSTDLNADGQLALMHELVAPESRVLHVARTQRYSLPRVNQLALHDIEERHRNLVWQQAITTPFDSYVLDGVRDHWLQSLCNISDREATVMHTINADNTTRALRRLQALQLNQSRFAQGRTAILMQYPVRLQCEHCKSPDNNTQAHQRWLNDWLEPDDTVESWVNPRYKGFMRSEGCDKCHHTGVANWTTIYEWLEFNDEIKSAISDDSWHTATSLLQLQQTVVQSVFKMARQGLISLAEAKRLLGPISL